MISLCNKCIHLSHTGCVVILDELGLRLPIIFRVITTVPLYDVVCNPSATYKPANYIT